MTLTLLYTKACSLIFTYDDKTIDLQMRSHQTMDTLKLAGSFGEASIYWRTIVVLVSTVILDVVVSREMMRVLGLFQSEDRIALELLLLN